ncbi:VOC family protein [Streptomyces werraensis]|uniref:VOC family protein n=1 Tax=Streptomyces werraensis TaxID=68284 RepID=UPI001CE249B8
MSAPFPHPISQLGFVVTDLQATMKHWIEELNVGPFFYAPLIEAEDFHHRGVARPAPFAAALANSGAMQIELIQLLDDAPSQWQEFRAAGREGLQHVGYWTQDFDTDYEAAIQAGYEVAHHGVLAGGRFVYFDTRHPSGCAIELSEQSPAKQAVFGAIREAAVDWDGRDPIRPYADITVSR